MKKKEDNFIIQGSILAFTSILVRLIGILYRVPLTNRIGAAGIGYYTSAYQIYSILLLLSSYSLPLAVSKMVSARIAKGEYKNAYRIFHTALIYAAVVGAVAAGITYFGADFFATTILKRPMCAYAIRTLAPTVLLVAFLGVFRGYFQGLGTMIPTALSQLFEQIINAAVSLIAANMMFQAGVNSNLVFDQTEFPSAFGAAGGTVGTGVGALAALLFFMVLFTTYKKVLLKRMKKDSTGPEESYEKLSKILFFTVVPVILSSAVYNISSVIDDAVFGNVMSYFSMSGENISELWGQYSGKYNLLTNVPIAIASALSSSIIPSLTRSVSNNDRGQVVEKVGMSIRFAMLIAIPSAVGLTVLAAPVMNLLFKGSDNQLASQMLLYGATAVVFFSLSTITNAILQGINHMKDPIKHALYSLGIHIMVLLFMLLVLKMGIYSVVFSNIIFAVCMCVFNALSISRYLDYRQEIRKTFILPLISSVIMGAATGGVYLLMKLITKSNAICTLIAMLVAVLVYGVLLLKLKCVDEVDLYNMPKGSTWIKMAKKIHLL